MTLVQPTNPVTLNLFQGPFLPTGRSPVGRLFRAVALLAATTERAARWMLKQVQHDGLRECGA